MSSNSMNSPGFKLNLTLTAHSMGVSSVKFSPDGLYLASSSPDKTVRVWDAETGRCCNVLRGHSQGVGDLSWSSDSRRISTCSDDRTVRIFNIQDRTNTTVLSGHTDCIHCVNYNSDSGLIASRSLDKTVRLFDVRSSNTLRVHRDYDDLVSSVHFSRDGSILASSSLDGNILFWDTRAGTLVKSINNAGGTPVSHVQFCANSKYFLAVTIVDSMRLWHYEELKVSKAYSGHRDGRYCIDSTFVYTMHPKHYVACGSVDGSIHIWELQTEKCVQRLNPSDGHTSIPITVSSHPYYNILASGSIDSDSSVKLWKAPQE